MGSVIAPTSLDTNLKELLNGVTSAAIQLPEFQRNWTWDDNRIRGILATLSQGYPMGAIMRLQYGSEDLRFQYRVLEGVKKTEQRPEYLILDGQQRLTSIFRATSSSEPVNTKTDKNKAISRFYYFDINKCLDESVDRCDAILSIPDDRKVKENFDKDITLDLSTRELEYQHEMFPINIIFDGNAREDWADGYKDFYSNTTEIREKYKRFRSDVLDIVFAYKLPVITLHKNTPKEAVCKVFENVNTGGVPLTVFELVTACFATHDFDLRKDWEMSKSIIWGKDDQLNTDVLQGIDETDFLTAITLYSSHKSQHATSCKKKDVLALQYESYNSNKNVVIGGFKMARKFLIGEKVFRKNDLPYTTQIIPLAVTCAVIGSSMFEKPQTQKILSQWYWCGIMGEMYGGANETRYAVDVEDLVSAIAGKTQEIRTIRDAYFSATRLLSLQTRLSAAYKGIMALIYKEDSEDFRLGKTMDFVRSMDTSPDIHHIFPKNHCIKMDYKEAKWNSIINKTPLLPESNRAIGGYAPSVYCQRLMKEAEITEDVLRARIESNLVDYDLLVANDFDNYFIDRAKKLLTVIEKAMGKTIADKSSEQTIQQFGCSLENDEQKNDIKSVL